MGSIRKAGELTDNPHIFSSIHCITTIQMNTFRTLISVIGDSTHNTDEQKLKAAQEISENWESIVANPQYPVLLQGALGAFCKILQVSV